MRNSKTKDYKKEQLNKYICWSGYIEQLRGVDPTVQISFIILKTRGRVSFPPATPRSHTIFLDPGLCVLLPVNIGEVHCLQERQLSCFWPLRSAASCFRRDLQASQEAQSLVWRQYWGMVGQGF